MNHLHPHRSDNDQVYQRYLDRAINDINELSHEIGQCGLCNHRKDFPHVLGTGHPLADIFLVKYRPRKNELIEGVSFFGESGQAIMNSMQRLSIDPLDLYGTNCIKCSDDPAPCERERCPTWLRKEIRIVSPRMLVVMGEPTRQSVNDLHIEDALEIKPLLGEIQPWLHECHALFVPDIDDSLEAPADKQEFWKCFRAIGEWYADKPPF